MKIILDESVPQKLRLLIEGGHSVVTVRYQGCSGLRALKRLNATAFFGSRDSVLPQQINYFLAFDVLFAAFGHRHLR
jgi:hypothetical protein